MILEEEALIRAYRAELAILKQQNSPGITNAAGIPGEDADEDDLLATMFTLPPSGSNDCSVVPLLASGVTSLSSSNTNKQECLELTQSLQGFVFSSVDNVHDVPPSPSLIKYILRGHFLTKPSVSACIRMTVEVIRRKITPTKRGPKSLPEQDDGRPSKKQRCHNNSSKVVNLECSLFSSRGEDVSHMMEASLILPGENSSLQSKSLPSWLQKVSAYLKFEQRQQECMLHWNRPGDEERNHPYVCSQKKYMGRLGAGSSSSSSRKASRPVCWIEPSSNASSHNKSSSKLPTFIWEWDWSQERDVLRMACTNEDNDESDDDVSALSPQGLKDLITCAGSCEKAILQILETFTHY